MLNVTGLTLAVALLPAEFALLRLGGGLVVGLLLTYLVSRLSARWARPAQSSAPAGFLPRLSERVMRSYGRLFRFEDVLLERPADSPAALISAWLALAWNLARVALPVLALGAIAAAAVADGLPSYGNNGVGVVIAAAFGTILMVPTWTEIAMAGPLIKEGVEGPAAALLLTLPAVSLPFLLIIGGALNAYRTALLLGVAVFLAGISAGLLVLAV
jgi:uncharacterized membrane protein YraQ (UPF0718 family)